jgi:hypothetical protein
MGSSPFECPSLPVYGMRIRLSADDGRTGRPENSQRYDDGR